MPKVIYNQPSHRLWVRLRADWPRYAIAVLLETVAAVDRCRRQIGQRNQRHRDRQLADFAEEALTRGVSTAPAVAALGNPAIHSFTKTK